MGWEVICSVTVEFAKKLSEMQKKAVKDILNKSKVSYFNYIEGEDYVTFWFSGNKGIDYEILDIIKNTLTLKVIKITSSEYSETGEGYYYDIEDEE